MNTPARAAGWVCLLAAPLLAASAQAAAAADEAALTLEALFDSPAFNARAPEELHFAPDGRSLVYRVDGPDGQSAWWREDVGTGAKSKLCDWGVARGELLAQRSRYVAPPMDDPNAGNTARSKLAWSPDGTQLAGLLSGDLYLLDLTSGHARFLTDDAALELFPTFSPDGARLAYVKDGELWSTALRAGGVRRLTDRGGQSALLNGMADWVYEEELDVQRSFWWSPDGRSLLFVQYDQSPVSVYPLVDELDLPARLEEQRYPQAGSANARVRLGLAAADGTGTSWIDLGAEPDFYLARAGFTPDGAHVWYQWLSRDQKRLELRLADVTTGASRRVLAEGAPTWVNVRDDLVFVDAERFVWTSERDGFRHVYLYRLDGVLQRRLTTGAWQVERVYAVDVPRQRVVFQATEKDARERHVYAVGLDGSGFTRLTHEAGTHVADFAPGGGVFVDKFSSAARPPRLELRAADGSVRRVLDDGALPGLVRTGPTRIEFGSVAADDGTPLATALIKPRAFDPSRRYPALLYVYGGPHAQDVRDEWGGMLHLFLRYLADQGLIVFFLDNRGSWGRGHAFEAAVRGRLGELESADQLAGVRHLKSLPFVDGARIGVYGGSYGGFMGLSLLLRAPDVFRAGVAYAPVTDWRLYDTLYTERYMGTPRDNAEGYRLSAPLERAAQLRAKLLLFHGTLDNNVHPQNTLLFADALREAGKPFELMLYPRVRHGIRRSRAKLDFHRRVAEFLLRELGVTVPSASR